MRRFAFRPATPCACVVHSLTTALALSVCSLGGAAFAASGDIFNLGTLNADDQLAMPAVINDNGVVVGTVMTSTGSAIGYRWSQSTGMTALSTDLGVPIYINNQNTILLNQFLSSSTTVLYADGQTETLPYVSSIAISNTNSTIVGSTNGYASKSWKSSNGDWETETLPIPSSQSSGSGYAVAINDNDVIVGRFGYCAGRYTTAGGSEDLGVLPGTFHDRSEARAINNVGTIVGQSNGVFGVFNQLAIRYTDADGMQPLDLSDYTDSVAKSINDGGIIAGVARTSGGVNQAVAWDAQGDLVNLNDWLESVNPDAASHWSLQEAYDINSSNLILGYGQYDGVGRTFVLDVTGLAVPEPSTIALLATGLVGLLAYAWQKRKSY